MYKTMYKTKVLSESGWGLLPYKMVHISRSRFMAWIKRGLFVRFYYDITPASINRILSIIRK